MTESVVSFWSLIDASVVSAFFSAIATGLAAFATWMGPIRAAKLAEELRQKATAEEEKRRLKLEVFTSLMMHRAAFYVEAAVKNLNLIDVVFHDNRAVRNAWADLFASFDGAKKVPEHSQNEKFDKLLNEIASDIGLSGSLLPDDLRRIYYPRPLADAELLVRLEREEKLRLFIGKGGPTANSAQIASSNDYWPPRP